MISRRRDIYDEIMNNTNPKSPKLKGIINIHMEQLKYSFNFKLCLILINHKIRKVGYFKQLNLS